MYVSLMCPISIWHLIDLASLNLLYLSCTGYRSTRSNTPWYLLFVTVPGSVCVCSTFCTYSTPCMIQQEMDTVVLLYGTR